jgi:hypothetical protein
MSQESVILCEGYHDRAFWGGWLKSLGCVVPQANNKALATRIVKDPWGRSVSSGQFGYHSPTGNFVRILKAADPTFTTSPKGDYLLDGGSTVVSVVVWWAPDSQADGLPWKHTLERLVCAALNATLSGRAQAVEQWLQNRPAGSPAGPKEYAWSNMAGWAADKGCEAFYSELWSQPQVGTELRSRLEKTGAWRIAEQVAA